MKKLGLLVKEKNEYSIKILKEFLDLPYKVKIDLTTIDSKEKKKQKYKPIENKHLYKKHPK